MINLTNTYISTKIKVMTMKCPSYYVLTNWYKNVNIVTIALEVGLTEP